jgi:hypothetical protein
VPYDKTIEEKTKLLLEEVVILYSFIFFPSAEEQQKELSENWKKTRQVCMQVFLNYFNTFELCYVEQVTNRINRWFGPFESEFKSITKSSISDFVRLHAFAVEYIQKHFDEMREVYKTADQAKSDFMEKHMGQDSRRTNVF